MVSSTMRKSSLASAVMIFLSRPGPRSGNLHQNALHTLALDRWLDCAKRVDALFDDRDRLLDRLPHAFDQRRLRHDGLDTATAEMRNLEGALAGCPRDASEGPRELSDLGQGGRHVASRTATSIPVPRTTGTLTSVSPASTRKTRLTSSRSCSSRSLRTQWRRPQAADASRRAGRGQARAGVAAHVGQLWTVFSEKKLGTASMLTRNAVSRMPNAFQRDMYIMSAPRPPMISRAFAGAPTGPTRRP